MYSLSKGHIYFPGNSRFLMLFGSTCKSSCPFPSPFMSLSITLFFVFYQVIQVIFWWFLLLFVWGFFCFLLSHLLLHNTTTTLNYFRLTGEHHISFLQCPKSPGAVANTSQEHKGFVTTSGQNRG